MIEQLYAQPWDYRIIDPNNRQVRLACTFSSADVLNLQNPTAIILKTFAHHVKVVAGQQFWMKVIKPMLKSLSERPERIFC